MTALDLFAMLPDYLIARARPYSGRGMYGAVCVGISFDSSSALRMLGPDVPAPRVDALGLGLIAYWPSIAWDEAADHRVDQITTGR